MHHVALKIPLAFFVLGGFFQCDDFRGTGVQVLHEALDGSTLAGCIAAFENDHNFLTGHFHPVLNLQEFNLEAGFLFFVFRPWNPVGIGIFAFLEEFADGLWVFS